MMLRQLKNFLKHSFIYSIGNFVSKAVGFFLIPVYTRYLSPLDYGVLELLYLVGSVVNIFLGMRINSAVVRFYYDYDNELEKSQVVSTAWISIFFISLVIIIFSHFFSSNISFWVFNTYIYEKYFNIVLICTALSLLATVPEAYLIAKKKSVFYTVYSVANLISYVSFNIYFVVFCKMGILGILYSSLITKILNTSFLSIYSILKNRLKFCFKKFISMVKFGVPLIPAAFGMFILNYADRFFLQKLATTSEVGIYSLGYKLAFMLPFLVLQPIQMIFLPQIFQIARQKEGSQIISRMFTYVFLIICFSALTICLFAKDIVYIMSTPAFYAAYKVIPYIVLGYVFMGIANFFQGCLMIKKSTFFIGLSIFVSALTNLILNFILIPNFGAMGAAYATSISFFVMFIFLFIFCQKIYPIKYEWIRIAKISLISLLVIFIPNLFNLSTSTLLCSILFKICVLFAFPVLLYTAKFFNNEEIYYLKFINKKYMTIFAKNW